ncbi:MAG: VanZ family protein [Lachnospiraceae bacterium]|nr:VanZ family protein [Lachnospiraceae bacterium]
MEGYRYRLRSRAIIFLILLLAWMTMIFVMSSMPGEESTEMSNIFLKLGNRFLLWIAPGSSLAFRSFLVRKMAHVTEYLILEIFMVFTLREWMRAKNKDVMRKSFYADLLLRPFLLGVLYAASDELHQYFVSERSAQIRDVCIDSIGLALGLLLSWLILNILYHRILRRTTLS